MEGRRLPHLADRSKSWSRSLEAATISSQSHVAWLISLISPEFEKLGISGTWWQKHETSWCDAPSFWQKVSAAWAKECEAYGSTGPGSVNFVFLAKLLWQGLATQQRWYSRTYRRLLRVVKCLRPTSLDSNKYSTKKTNANKNTSLFEEKHKQKQNKKPNDYFEDQKQQKKNNTKHKNNSRIHLHVVAFVFFFSRSFLSQLTWWPGCKTPEEKTQQTRKKSEQKTTRREHMQEKSKQTATTYKCTVYWFFFWFCFYVAFGFVRFLFVFCGIFLCCSDCFLF